MANNKKSILDDFRKDWVNDSPFGERSLFSEASKAKRKAEEEEREKKRRKSKEIENWEDFLTDNFIDLSALNESDKAIIRSGLKTLKQSKLFLIIFNTLKYTNTKIKILKGDNFTKGGQVQIFEDPKLRFEITLNSLDVTFILLDEICDAFIRLVKYNYYTDETYSLSDLEFEGNVLDYFVTEEVNNVLEFEGQVGSVPLLGMDRISDAITRYDFQDKYGRILASKVHSEEFINLYNSSRQEFINTWQEIYETTGNDNHYRRPSKNDLPLIILYLASLMDLIIIND